MSLAIERKYILALSHRFQGFIQKSPVLYNCRCALCGDGEGTKKKRGFFYQKDNHWWYHCHNRCGTMSIKNLLMRMDYGLYKQYNMELFEAHQHTKKELADPVAISRYATDKDWDNAVKELRSIPKISQLTGAYAAPREYLNERHIPTPMHSVLRWAPAFKSWTNRIVPKKFDPVVGDHGRIVIPFFSEDNIFFAYIGRVIDQSEPRYILIYFDKEHPLIYGMNGVKLDEKVYVVEGPLDSMFLPNCVAMCGSNLGIVDEIKAKEKVIIFDNEPHHPDTKKHIVAAIEHDYKVCIWPPYHNGKDINKMVELGMTPAHIKTVIDKNTYSGLEAKMHLSQWSKL